jgi:hypothetical protein
MKTATSIIDTNIEIDNRVFWFNTANKDDLSVICEENSYDLDHYLILDNIFLISWKQDINANIIFLIENNIDNIINDFNNNKNRIYKFIISLESSITFYKSFDACFKRC